jgi:xanthosine phosphorylase
MSAHEAAAEAIHRAFAPRLCIVLGSGLGAIAERIEAVATLSYAELPGFPAAKVEGHAGKIVLGRLGGLAVACLQGRAHWYEARSAAAMAVPIRALKAAGAEHLLLTNAAGSLRPEVGPGRLMMITDHINLIPDNPLAGPNDDRIGPRFPSMRDAYAPRLRDVLRAAASRAGVDLAEGIYAAYPGPSFETPAEIRALRVLGADAVGMSTAPETILARHCGLEVAAVSVVTNLAEGLSEEPLSHARTLAAATGAARDLAALAEEFSSLIASP